MKTILSWNVNGIRAGIRKGFLTWLDTSKPDILCMQETKAHPDQVDDMLTDHKDYYTYWDLGERKGYSGVATLSKEEPLKTQTMFGSPYLDDEGRTLLTEYKNFVLINSYCPNGKRSPERLAYKLAYYDEMLTLLVKLRKEKKYVIWTGDVNTAHTEIDLARPKQNENVSGFLPEERAWIDKLISSGFVDTLREFHPEPELYTWWDMKSRARDRNVGWRIDYFFVSEETKKHLKDAFTLPDVMGSDHCPVGITIDL